MSDSIEDNSKFYGSCFLSISICFYLSGLDIKGGMVAADSSRFNTVEEYTAFYFSTHSRELLVQVQKITHTHPSQITLYNNSVSKQSFSIRIAVHILHSLYVSVCILYMRGDLISYLTFSSQAVVNILKQKDIEANPGNLIEYLRPFRIIISLLDKPEIGKVNCKMLYFGPVLHNYLYFRILSRRAIGVV